MSRPRLVALILALVTLAVYLPVVGNGFINYDDVDYLAQNKMVQGGLTLAGFKWAFTTIQSANWHPLTWLSLMMDCEWFGVNAAGSHFVNALFHAANGVLLFALWLRMTQGRRENATSQPELPPRALWPAALVAALFAIHPLHVESVAWVAERKDVLSAFFGLLALWGYAGYAAGSRGKALSYGLALFFFACGLMSKPMLVTWPFVMLLLDYWPLGRWNVIPFPRLLLEKIPFIVLTVASCIVTYLAQSHGDAIHRLGAVQSLASVPLDYRLENAPVAVAGYLLKLAWPARLAIIYPMPPVIAPAAIAVSSVVLILITVAAWVERKRNPFLLMGWLWFLGTLVPVIGLVKVGDAAMADRYTYLPSIGIFVMLAYGVQKLDCRYHWPKWLGPVAAGGILLALAAVTWRQIHFWRDDETLFEHATQVTTDNVDALINYGVALEYAARPMAALEQYRRAQKIAPDSYMACVDLGNLFSYMGKPEEALEQYQRAVQLEPNLRTVRDGLGNVLAGLGHFDAATNEYYAAMKLDPGSAAPHLYLGITLAAHGDFPEATNQFSEAIRLAPGDPAPLVEWARALMGQGRDAEALDELRQALPVDPDNFQTLAFLAHVLAADEHPEIRDGAAALTFAQKAGELTGGAQPLVQDVLAMAYAETGQFDDAQKTENEAIQLATNAGMKPETIAEMQKRLKLFQAHQPWRESFANTSKLNK